MYAMAEMALPFCCCTDILEPTQPGQKWLQSLPNHLPLYALICVVLAAHPNLLTNPIMLALLKERRQKIVSS